MIWDFLRFLALAEGALIFMGTLRIIVTYFRVWRKAPERLRLLPLHVWLLGVGTCTYTTKGSIDVIAKLGEPVLWHNVPFVLLANTCILVGIVLMLRHLHYKRIGLPELIP